MHGWSSNSDNEGLQRFGSVLQPELRKLVLCACSHSDDTIQRWLCDLNLSAIQLEKQQSERLHCERIFETVPVDTGQFRPNKQSAHGQHKPAERADLFSTTNANFVV